MKARFVKSIMCLALAGTLIMGEAGTVLAAEPAEISKISAESLEDTVKAVETTVPEETEETAETTIPEETEETAETTVPEETEETTEAQESENQAENPVFQGTVEGQPQDAVQPRAATASVTSFDGSLDSYYRELYISFSGYAAKFEIYVNNKLWQTITNDDENYADNAYSDSLYFSNMIPGANYTFKIVPYDGNGTAGSEKTFSKKPDAIKVSSMSANVYGETVYDANGNTTGYRRPYVSLEVNLSNSGYSQTYEIYRAVGKKTASYKKIGTVNTSSSYFYYSDRSVGTGNTYYYKVRGISGKDAYVTTAVTGAYSSINSATVEKPSANCYVAYEGKYVTVSLDYSSYTSGFEIYRSTKKSKGYKKIATTSDTVYTDKKAKSGKTYYYKAKPYYYNTADKKKYYGDFSEPAGVKLLLGSIFAEASQTGSSQVKLTWDSVAGAKNYEIYYKSSLPGDAYKRLGTTKKTSYTAKKLSSDLSYYFQIRAVKTSNSLKSYFQSYSVSVNLGFKAPGNFRIASKKVSISGNKATITSTLKWDRVYGASGYRIEGYTSYTGYKTLKTISKASTTSYTLKNTIGSGSTYYTQVRIVALKGKQESYSSSIYNGLTTLNTVTKVKVKRVNSGSAKVTWQKTAGADTYDVYRKAPTGNSIHLGQVKTNSFVDKTLTPGVNYTYTIYASNTKVGISDSYYSYNDKVTNTAVYNHKLGTPTISSVKNSSSKKATITWKAVSGAQKYVVYRSGSKKGSYKKVGTVSGKTTYTNSKLSKGKTYYYKVEAIAVNDAGISVTSAKSAVKSVKIKK